MCEIVKQTGEVSELVDERDLGSRAERRGGSSPSFPTIKSALSLRAISTELARG